jgi:hypothetical protein
MNALMESELGDIYVPIVRGNGRKLYKVLPVGVNPLSHKHSECLFQTSSTKELNVFLKGMIAQKNRGG